MNLSPFSFTPIIIIGAPRSGTNMLRDALTSCDGATTWRCDEINAIWRHHNARFPSDELKPAQATFFVKRYIRHAFQRLARRTQATWVVEKTCANSLRVDFVRAILPEAKFVFLVREGADVVASSMKRWQAGFDLRYTLGKARYVPPGDIPSLAMRFVANRVYRVGARTRRLGSWGPKFDGMQKMLRERSLAEVCAEQWRRCVTIAAVDLAACRADQVCFVRYEKLVADTQSEIGRITAFAGIEMTAEQRREFASAVSPKNVGKWRSELDADMLLHIEPLIRPTMKSIESWDSRRVANTNHKFAA